MAIGLVKFDPDGATGFSLGAWDEALAKPAQQCGGSDIELSGRLFGRNEAIGARGSIFGPVDFTHSETTAQHQDEYRSISRRGDDGEELVQIVVGYIARCRWRQDYAPTHQLGLIGWLRHTSSWWYRRR